MKSLQELSTNGIIMWGLGIFSSLLFIYVQFQNDRIKTIENQLSEKKYKLYSELVTLVYEAMRPESIGGVKITQDQIALKFFELKKDMFFYAPDKIYFKFLEYISSVNDPKQKSSKPEFQILDILILIRKDMGYKDSKVNKDDLMLSLLQSKDELKKFKEM